MATVAPPADKAADLMQGLSLTSQTKTPEVPNATKKTSSIKYGSVDGGEANGAILPFERSVTPNQDYMDPNMYYLSTGYPSTPYYYGSFDGQGDYDVDISPGVYGDSGSLVYHPGYGYAPYGAYPPPGSPVPTMGHDGQLYGPQHYQYPTPYYPPQNTPNGLYTTNQAPASQGEVPTPVLAEQMPLSVETARGNSNGTLNGGVHVNGPTPLRPNHQNSSLNSNGSYGRGVFSGGIPASGYQDPRFGFDGPRSPFPWQDGTTFSDAQPKSNTSSSISSTISQINNTSSGRNQNLRPLPHLMGLNHSRPSSGMGPAPGIMNRMYSNNRMYNQFGNNVRSGPGFNGYDSRTNGRGWLAVDNKYKPRGRGNSFNGYGNENLDGFSELPKGPRARGIKNQKVFAPITLAVKGQNLPLNGNINEDKDTDSLSVIPDKEQFNQPDFLEKYSDAKFFIIKSYSEDDIHKSIKYSVWASTPNGNKKLDAGYQEALEKSGACPVFLFFSVNTSGQFVGLAEMVGPVDFNKNLEYWQQDKWNGCFPLKWHIVKDVPNSLLKHITLEYNENKPVTNSRDTQEVKLEQGLQMIKIFKDHSSKTCILDDFSFYEARQKTMQEKRAKQQQQQHIQKQVLDEKPSITTGTVGNNKEVTNGRPRVQKPLEVPVILLKEPVASTGEKPSEENGSVTTS